MAQIYCRKNSEFEFVVYPHYHNHVAIIKKANGLAFKLVLSSEAFCPPYFEVNVANAYFTYKKRVYRVSEAEELTAIPDWFRDWNRTGNDVKLRMNDQEIFMFNGLKAKREAFMEMINPLPA